MQDLIIGTGKDLVSTTTKRGQGVVRVQTQKEFCDAYKASHKDCGNAVAKRAYMVHLRENARTGFDTTAFVKALETGKIGISKVTETKAGMNIAFYGAGVSVEQAVSDVKNDVASMSREERERFLALLKDLGKEDVSFEVEKAPETTPSLQLATQNA